MKILRQSIFLPVFALIAFLGFGAGTVLADTGNEGVGGWSSEAVAPGQVSVDLSGNPYSIDGSGDVRFTSQATGSQPKRRAFVGTLSMPATSEGTGVTATTITSLTFTLDLQTSGGVDQVDISLPAGAGEVNVTAEGFVENTIFKFPGGDRAGAFEDGARVVVLAEQTEGGDWEAVWILVKPVKPPVTLHGVVVATDGGEITVETPDGDTEIVTLPEGAGDVTPGDVITVFRGNSGQAKGLVRAEAVKNRLKRFLNDAEEDVDEPEEAEDGKGNKHDRAAAHAEKIAKFLARFSERQTRMLDRVMDRAPERVRAKLARVRERIQAQRAEHREAIVRIRAKLDRIHPDHLHRGRPEAVDDHRPRLDSSDRGRPETADRPRRDNSSQARPESTDRPRPHDSSQARPESTKQPRLDKADQNQDGSSQRR